MNSCYRSLKGNPRSKANLRLSTKRRSCRRIYLNRHKKELSADQKLSAEHSSSASSSVKDTVCGNREEFFTELRLNNSALKDIDNLYDCIEADTVQNEISEDPTNRVPNKYDSENELFFNDVALQAIKRIEINNSHECIEGTTGQNKIFEDHTNEAVNKYASEDELFFNDEVLQEIECIEINNSHECIKGTTGQNKIFEASSHFNTDEHSKGKNENKSNNDFNLESIEELSNEIVDPVDPSERCIINILHFMNEIRNVFSTNFHQSPKCTSNNIKFVGAKRFGLRQQFIFHCDSCNDKFKISSEPTPEHNGYMDVNTCAVAGTRSSGTDYSELEEILAYMGVHCMSEKSYHQINDFVQTASIEIADEEMKRAGAEERKMAEENNCREGDYLACTVKIDGTWCTRSYGSQGRSKSGATVIVGKNTNKILFYGVRNKYCQICAQAKNRNEEPRLHSCYKNWSEDQSSCAMESDAAVEGFMRSIEDHQLVYSKVISDRDSSVYLRLLQADPYKDIFIQKVDCVTHLLCNLGKELKKVAKTKTGKAGADCKKSLLRNICRIRYDIQAAAVHRNNEENYTFEEKMANLQKDIRNVPYHVFGQHDNCDQYFCNGKPKENEINVVSEMINLGLFEGITNAVDDLSYQTESLLNNENTNIVESINSVICKKIGSKRKNKIQRGAYNGAVALATIHINTRRAGSVLNDFLECTAPTVLIDMENRRIQKNIINVQELQENTTKRKYEVICSDDEDIENNEKQSTQNIRKKPCKPKEGKKDYGKNCQKPDMKSEEFNDRVFEHYRILQQKLKATTSGTTNSQQIINTNHERFKEEKYLLMDRYFGEICRMRSTNYGASMIRKILCQSVRKVIIDKYERTGKVSAREVLKKQGMETKECGLFIYKKFPYLAARPDCITSTVKRDDTITIIMCPHKAKNLTPDEAIQKKIEKLHNIFSKDLNGLNENHHLFYRLIGAIEITGKAYGLFVLWTKKGIKTVRIGKNEEFWRRNMERQLASFYEQKLIPEIVDSRMARTMPIRTTDEIKVTDYTSFCNDKNNEKLKLDNAMEVEADNNYSNDENGNNISEINWCHDRANDDRCQTPHESDDHDEISNDKKDCNSNDEEMNSNKSQTSDENDNDAVIHKQGSSVCHNEETDNNELRTPDNSNNSLNDEFVNDLFRIDDLSEENISILQSTQFLNTDHMDYFASIMKRISNGYYDAEYTAKIQSPDRIRAVCPLKSHIQILNNPFAKHWVCSFYDTEKIYIYDSMNSKKLHKEERIFLQHLYPYYDFDNNPVIFPTVQDQKNGYSCGEYSIAFAITLMYGLKPESIAHDRHNMRPHLLQMLLKNRIQHFPRTNKCTNIPLPSLKEALKTARDASEIAHDLNITNSTCLCGQRNSRRSKQIDVNTNELETIVID